MLLSGAGAFILSNLAVARRCSVGDERRWGLRYVPLAAVPRVAVYLMEAAVSGERVVETWHAAMETALFCASVNHSVTPERGGGKNKKRCER